MIINDEARYGRIALMQVEELRKEIQLLQSTVRNLQQQLNNKQ